MALKAYGYAWITLALFLLSITGHRIFGWVSHPAPHRSGERRADDAGARSEIHAAMRSARWLAVLLLLGKPESTAFTAREGGFEFRAIADAAYPEASSNGEAWRIRWLEQRLRERGLCPNGYVITSRETRKRATGALGSIFDVYYAGKCAQL